MAIIAKKISGKTSSIIDGLKMYALAALTYDIRRFVYNLAFLEVFKYVVAISFIFAVPVLIVLSFLASVYAGYLFWELNPYYPLWTTFALSGFLISYLFFHFSKKLIFTRTKSVSSLWQTPDNPAEVFIARLVQELKQEQLLMAKSFNEKKSNQEASPIN